MAPGGAPVSSVKTSRSDTIDLSICVGQTTRGGVMEEHCTNVLDNLSADGGEWIPQDFGVLLQ